MTAQRISHVLESIDPAAFLRALLTSETVSSDAYELPWLFSFDDEGSAVLLRNASSRVLRFVQIYSARASPFGISLPETVFPGESISFSVQDFLPASLLETGYSLMLRWREETGARLVWPIAW